MSVVRKSLEFSQSMLDEELGTVKNDIKKLAFDMKELKKDLLDPNEVLEKLIELKDRLRRNTLRIDSLIENTNETWDDCEKKLQEALQYKLSIQDDIEFDRYHCMGKRRESRPRTIICRCVRFKDKQKILQNAKKLKNTGIYIYEDFCKDTMELRKSLWEEVLNYRCQGKFAYLNYRSVVVRDDS